MRETKKKQIGDRGITYHVTQLGARQGGRALVRILKMIGGAAGEAMAAGEGFGSAVIGKAVGNLAETVSETDFDFLCDTFAPATEVHGGAYTNPLPLSAEGVFDLHFAGAYQELGSWLLFAIEVNYGGFFGASGLVQKARAATAPRASVAKPAVSESQSPSTSPTTGRSGG